MRVMLVGAGGQLGAALQRVAPPDFELIALGRLDLDIGCADAVGRILARCSPDLLINAAAYTAVDQAEAEPDLAFRVNADGPRLLAEAAARCDAGMIHVSTDFVFAGDRPQPYGVGDVPGPASTYGRSKLAGEESVLSLLGKRATVVRTSWLYSRRGANFVTTMVQLMRTRDSIGVVFDQVGTPTWVNSLAAAIWVMAGRPDVHGMQHWSDEGVASWYDFAVAIQEECLDRGILRRPVPVRAICSSEYPTRATRPRYSVLDKGSTAALLGYRPPHWRQNLRSMLDEFGDA